MIAKTRNTAIYASIFMALLSLTVNIDACAQQVPAVAAVRHVPLDLNQAMRAIDAMVYLREKFQRNGIGKGTPAQMVRAMKSKGNYAGIQTALLKFGFTSPESWSQIVMSSIMAIGFVRNNGDKNMPQQMAELQRSGALSAKMKAQLLDTTRTMTPPEANMKIARQILGDASYTDKVTRLFDN